MEFHHLGVATSDINASIKIFTNLGFISDGVIFDEIQKVNICFMRKTGHPDIELIEPAGDKSPVRDIINKVGTTPYHLCYFTNDIIQEIANLKKDRFILVVKPVEAIAFNNKRICFCYNKDFGLLELVEI
jgi:methylmalonyl-CoA/ethylmalonyl-CoA epimerase